MYETSKPNPHEILSRLEHSRWLPVANFVGALAITAGALVGLPTESVVEAPPHRSLTDAEIPPAISITGPLASDIVIVKPKLIFPTPTEVVPKPKTHLRKPVKPTTAVSPPRPAPAPIPPKRVSYSALRRSNEVTPMSPATEAKIEAMNLTLDGYQNFLKSIGTSYLQYSQQFPPFNPDKVAIRQGKSEFFSWHFTALYMNADGISHTEAKGDMDVAGLIKSMAGRSDVCCGINWIMDRYGNVNQTAPVNAKLRHNPPYDGVTTGVEFEALTQDGITTKQYENGAYLTIAVLNQQGLLNLPPKQSMHGHGEDRDLWRAKWLQEHKTKPKWDVRNDFDKPVSEFYRERIALFLDKNPTIGDIAVNFR